jgi:hypothetical protein
MVTTRTSRGVVGGQGLDRLALAFDDERVVANAGLVLASTLADRLPRQEPPHLQRVAGETKPTHVICPTTLIERDSAWASDRASSTHGPRAPSFRPAEPATRSLRWIAPRRSSRVRAGVPARLCEVQLAAVRCLL